MTEPVKTGRGRRLGSKNKAPKKLRSARVDPRLKTPRGPGRPKHVATPTSRGLVRMALLMNRTQDEIAAASGIDLKTLRKYYREEIQSAKFEIGGALMQTLITRAMGGVGAAARWEDSDFHSLRWLLEIPYGMGAKPVEVHHSGAVGSYDLDKLDKDALLNLRTILAPLAIAGPDRRSDSEEGS